MRTRHYWSTVEITRLMNLCAENPGNLRQVFREYAEELGSTCEAVERQYYLEKKRRVLAEETKNVFFLFGKKKHYVMCKNTGGAKYILEGSSKGLWKNLLKVIKNIKHKWHYKPEEEILETREAGNRRSSNHNAPRAVICYTKDNEFVNEFPSLSEAGRSINPNGPSRYHSILKCCKGDTKSAYGYIWRYK